MTENFNERRKFQRIYRNFIMSYNVKGKNDAVEVSQISNISRGGASFISTHPVKLGAVLDIQITTPYLSEKIFVSGVVLECAEKVNELLYQVRVQFNNISEDTQDILQKIELYTSREN